jgi:hypothetical protein
MSDLFCVKRLLDRKLTCAFFRYVELCGVCAVATRCAVGVSHIMNIDVVSYELCFRTSAEYFVCALSKCIILK